MTSSDYILFSL